VAAPWALKCLKFSRWAGRDPLAHKSAMNPDRNYRNKKARAELVEMVAPEFCGSESPCYPRLLERAAKPRQWCSMAGSLIIPQEISTYSPQFEQADEKKPIPETRKAERRGSRNMCRGPWGLRACTKG